MFRNHRYFKNVFSSMVNEQFRDIEPSLFNHACGRHFVQNMSVFHSCSNHVSISDGTRPPLRDTREGDYRAFCVRKFSLLPNPDQSLIEILNESYPEY